MKLILFKRTNFSGLKKTFDFHRFIHEMQGIYIKISYNMILHSIMINISVNNCSFLFPLSQVH